MLGWGKGLSHARVGPRGLDLDDHHHAHAHPAAGHHLCSAFASVHCHMSTSWKLPMHHHTRMRSTQPPYVGEGLARQHPLATARGRVGWRLEFASQVTPGAARGLFTPVHVYVILILHGNTKFTFWSRSITLFVYVCIRG
jgi:hypothetical protein